MNALARGFPLWFSALFRHMSFPFAVVTSNNPLFPRVTPTCSRSESSFPQLVVSSRYATQLDHPTTTPSLPQAGRDYKDKNDHHMIDSIQLDHLPCLETRIVKHLSLIGKDSDWLVGYRSADEIDKETVVIGEMQLKQEDRSCVHASIELHLHAFHVVPSEHESDQH
ncbi:hypothetical protein Tco_1146355 [Tanacetum coccineum]